MVWSRKEQLPSDTFINHPSTATASHSGQLLDRYLAPSTRGMSAHHDSPDLTGKRDNIPFCTSQLLRTDFLSHIHSNRAASQMITWPTPPAGRGWNWSASLPTFLLDKFCKLMPLPEVSKRQILGIKAARGTQKVQLIKTVNKSLDHFGIRFFLQTWHSDNTLEQHTHTLSPTNMTFTSAQSFVLCIDSAHLIIPA